MNGCNAVGPPEQSVERDRSFVVQVLKDLLDGFACFFIWPFVLFFTKQDGTSCISYPRGYNKCNRYCPERTTFAVCFVFTIVGFIYLCLAPDKGSDVNDMVAAQNTAVREWKDGNFRAFKDSFCGDDDGCHFDINGTYYYVDSFGMRVDLPVHLTLSKQTEVVSEDWRYSGPPRLQQDLLEYGSESYTDALWFKGEAVIQAPDDADMHSDLTAVSSSKTSTSHFERIELQSGCREFVHESNYKCQCSRRRRRLFGKGGGGGANGGSSGSSGSSCATCSAYYHRIEIQRLQSVDYYAPCSSSQCDASAALKEGGGSGYDCTGYEMETVFRDLYECSGYSEYSHSNYTNETSVTCPGQKGEEWACSAMGYAYLSSSFTIPFTVRSTNDPYVHKGDVSDCKWAIDKWGYTDYLFVGMIIFWCGVLMYTSFQVVKFMIPEPFDGWPDDRRPGCFLVNCTRTSQQGITSSPATAVSMGHVPPTTIAYNPITAMPPQSPQPAPIAPGHLAAPHSTAPVDGYPPVPVQTTGHPQMYNTPQAAVMPDHVESICCPFCNVAMQNPYGQQAVQCFQCMNVIMTPN